MSAAKLLIPFMSSFGSPQTSGWKDISGSSKEAARAAPPSESVIKCQFIARTVRVMAFRSWVRKFEGCRESSSARILGWHALTCLLMCACACLACASAIKHRSHDDFSTIIIGCVCVCLVPALFLPFINHNTLNYATNSIALSKITCLILFVWQTVIAIHKQTLLDTGSFLFQACPLQSKSIFPLALFVYALLQALLSSVALAYKLLAMPIMKYYYMKSGVFVKRWGVTILEAFEADSVDDDDPKFGIYLRACPQNHQYSIHSARTLTMGGRLARFVSSNAGQRIYGLLSWCLLEMGVMHSRHFTPMDQYMQVDSVSPDVCCASACLFIGTVDRNGIVQGSGFWSQGHGSPHGETLMGTWNKGRPVAPFRSRQTKCGSGFSCLKFAWVKFDYLENQRPNVSPKDDDLMVPYLTDSHFEFGISEVECCVFGNFFNGFPQYAYYHSSGGDGCPTNKPSALKMGLNNRFLSQSSFDVGSTESTASGYSSPSRMSLQLPMSETADIHETVKLPSINMQGDKSRTSVFIAKNLSILLQKLIPAHAPLSDSENVEEKREEVMMARASFEAELSPVRRLLKVPTNSLFDSKPTIVTKSEQAEPKLNRRTSALDILVSPTNRPDIMIIPPLTKSVNSPHAGSRTQRITTMLKKEALIFIHGYKTAHSEAPLLMGQMLALGNFPNRLKPFMFLWPAGVQAWEFFEAREAANDKLCQEALLQFIAGLAQNGFSDAHIIVHSMGSRLLLNALNKDKKFQQDAGRSTMSSVFLEKMEPHYQSKIKLVNLVIFNGEEFLDEFVNVHYGLTKDLASTISIYCDRNDKALASAEMLSCGRQCMGRHPFGFVRPRQKQDSSQNFEWLDLDVIDTTYLDANVHSLRHCFFNINQFVINDLRALIVSSASACHRKGTLERRMGNVFTFRKAPAHLNTVFRY